MHQIKLTLRRIYRDKVVSLAGILGLSIGLISVLLIAITVYSDYSTDQFHSNIDRIFSIDRYIGEDKETLFKGIPSAIAPIVKEEYPEIIETGRFRVGDEELLLRNGENSFIVDIDYGDLSLFNIFSFSVKYGVIKEGESPYKIVLDNSTALKIFGDTNPVGQSLIDKDGRELTVMAVIHDIPSNSTIKFQGFIPIQIMTTQSGSENYLSSWSHNGFITYGVLNRADSFQKISATLPDRVQKSISNSINNFKCTLFKDEFISKGGRQNKNRILILIASIILIAATLNFINLKTAQSYRFREESRLKRSFGASDIDIVKELFSDIATLAGISYTIAIITVAIGLPLFNKIIGQNYTLKPLLSLQPALILLGIFIFTIFISGVYPLIAKKRRVGREQRAFINIVTGVMYVVSITLINITFTVDRQSQYLLNKEVGFDKDKIIYIELNGALTEHAQILKEKLLKSPLISNATIAAVTPNNINWNRAGFSWDGKDPSLDPLINLCYADSNFVNTMGAEMSESDSHFGSNSIIINRAFADIIGWDSFVGKEINSMRIGGVVEKMHFNLIKEEIAPLAILPRPQEGYMDNYLLLRRERGTAKELLSLLNKECSEIEPDFPLHYSFLDSEYEAQLKSELTLKRQIELFSYLSLVILALGLLGMVLYVTDRGTKEIGIRQYLGESTAATSIRLIVPFIRSGVIAGAIATPISLLLIEWWLRNYTFRVSVTADIFIYSTLLVIIISLLIVGWQILKSARRNPIEALRSE